MVSHVITPEEEALETLDSLGMLGDFADLPDEWPPQNIYWDGPPSEAPINWGLALEMARERNNGRISQNSGSCSSAT